MQAKALIKFWQSYRTNNKPLGQKCNIFKSNTYNDLYSEVLNTLLAKFENNPSFPVSWCRAKKLFTRKVLKMILMPYVYNKQKQSFAENLSEVCHDLKIPMCNSECYAISDCVYEAIQQFVFMDPGFEFKGVFRHMVESLCKHNVKGGVELRLCIEFVCYRHGEKKGVCVFYSNTRV